MRAQRAGVIITISSVAAWKQYPNVAYKATKAGMIAFTQQVAIQNAEFGVRANVILPGLIDTPMAVDTRARFPAPVGRSACSHICWSFLRVVYFEQTYLVNAGQISCLEIASSGRRA